MALTLQDLAEHVREKLRDATNEELINLYYCIHPKNSGPTLKDILVSEILHRMAEPRIWVQKSDNSLADPVRECKHCGKYTRALELNCNNCDGS